MQHTQRWIFSISPIVFVIGLMILQVTTDTARADDARKQAMQSFSIPAQPLEQAIEAFIAATDWQIGFVSYQTKGIRSTPVKGRFTKEQALKKLLEGTDLQYRFVEKNSITLQPAAHSLSTEMLMAMHPMEDYMYAAAEPDEEPYDGPVEQMDMTVQGMEVGYSVLNASTATKTDTPIMETPMSVQVVPRAVMDDQQAISLGDALKNVSGVQPSGNTFYDNFILRGFDSNFNTYRNGLRQPNVTSLETANLERIEVLKGPAAMLFGRVEPGGLVNLTTKRPLNEAYYSVQQQFGSYDLYRTTVDATGPVLDDKSLLYRMNIAYNSSNSFQDFVNQEHVFVAPSLTWRPTDRFEGNFDIEYQHDDFVDHNDAAIPAVGNRPAPIPITRLLGDPAATNTQDRILVGLNWSFRFNDDWKLTNRFQILDATYNQTSVTVRGLEADNRTLSRGLWHTHGQRNTYATNLDLTGHFTTGILEHDVLIGFDFYRYEEEYAGFAGSTPLVPSIDIYNPVYGIDLSSLTSSDNNFHWQVSEQWEGIYFQDQITLWDKLHILGGGRYDWAEYGSGYSGTSLDDISQRKQRVGFFSPRIGILYQPWSWLSLYGNYVESLSTNNSGRSFHEQQFDPQTAQQYEAGIKTEFFGGRLSSTLAFFDLTKQNILTADPDHPTFNIAIGEVNSQGVEWDVSGQVTENWSLIGSYAYTDAKITKDNNGDEGNRLPSVPRHSGSLWTKYEFSEGMLQGLSLGTGVFIRGQRQGDNANSVQLPGYARWDASIGYSFKQLGSKITTQLNVYNLLDKKYYDRAGSRDGIQPGEPLTFLGSVRVEF